MIPQRPNQQARQQHPRPVMPPRPQPVMATVFPLEELTWICTSMCDLLEIENAALARHDTQTVRELTENKTALARMYEKTLLSIGTDGQLAKQLTPEEHVGLSELSIRMTQLMDRNVVMLRAGIEARQKVMDIFVSAARARSRQVTSYGKQGVYVDPKAERGRTSLTYNKML